VSGFILKENSAGDTDISVYDLQELPFEIGPGHFKGLGGTVVGEATRLMMLRIEKGADLPLHRATPGFAIVLSGSVEVGGNQGSSVKMRAGDVMRVETKARGPWRLFNTSDNDVFIALMVMPTIGIGSPSS